MRAFSGGAPADAAPQSVPTSRLGNDPSLGDANPPAPPPTETRSAPSAPADAGASSGGQPWAVGPVNLPVNLPWPKLPGGSRPTQTPPSAPTDASPSSPVSPSTVPATTGSSGGTSGSGGASDPLTSLSDALVAAAGAAGTGSAAPTYTILPTAADAGSSGGLSLGWVLVLAVAAFGGWYWYTHRKGAA